MFVNQLNNALSIDTLRNKIPSAFAEDASAKVSNRYQYLPSYPLIEYMMANGFKAFDAYQSRSRTAEGREHVKHLVRFVNTDIKVGGSKVGDTFASSTFTNSHDGTSSFTFQDSVWRQACGNGLMVVSSLEDILRIRHYVSALEKLKEQLPAVLARFDKNSKIVEDFSIIKLNEEEQNAFAAMAIDLRWQPENSEGVIISTAPIHAEKLLVTRRTEDNEIKDTLWGSLNIIQENIMQGGQRGISSGNTRLTVRPVKSVDTDLRVNKALWSIADGIRMAKAS